MIRITIYLGIILGLCPMVHELRAQSASARPNVILIMCDDLGWGDVGFNGNAVVQTPHLDRLAARGVILDRFYSAGPVCSPTRASCLTGRNPNRIEIHHANNGHLKPQEITLPELLKEEGYQTGHFGKWHLGTLTTVIEDANRGRPGDYSHYSTPAHHGYDAYFATESKVPTFDPMIRPVVFDSLQGESLRYGWSAIEPSNAPANLRSYGTHYWKGREQIELDNVSGSNARIIMDRVLPFVRGASQANVPFFATIWFHTPHLPLVASEKFRSIYAELSHQEQLLYGAITAMDEQIGRLWATLEYLGQAEQTILWFCSDNGPEVNTPGSAGPFRGRKRDLYEGGVRVPAFCIAPQLLGSNLRIDAPLVTSDYLPTILSILNKKYPDQRPLDGINVLPLLMQVREKRENPIGFLFQKRQSWVEDDYKLISYDAGETFELYHLVGDPGEAQNMVIDDLERAQAMKNDLNEWLNTVEESILGSDYAQ